MKKIIISMLTLALVLSTFNRHLLICSAEEIKENYTAKAICLMDYDTGEILESKNAHDKLPIASMTKIMTLNIIFDEINQGNLNYDDIVTVSKRASGMGGSQVFLSEGTQYKVSELIKTIIVASANDSTVAMAEHIAGSVEEFVSLMNDKATELNMTNTNFSNPTGLPIDTAYSCANDVAIMTRALLNNQDFYKFANVWMDTIEHENGRVTDYSSTNKLLKRNIGVDGGKTGFTSQALHCISATAKRGDMRIISVIIGANSSKERFDECAKLLDYGFNTFNTVKILDKTKQLTEQCDVKRGRTSPISGIPERDYSVTIKKKEVPSEEIEIIYDKLKAPINKGDKIGVVNVYKNNQLIDTINILAKDDAEKLKLFEKA